MTRTLTLLIGMCAASTLLAQPAPSSPSIEARVADAVALEVRARMGSAAVVSVEHVQVAVKKGSTGSVAVTLAPGARLDAPVEFGVVGAGTSGHGTWIGRGRADVHVSVPYAVVTRTIARGTVLTAGDVVDKVGAPGGVVLQRLPTVVSLTGATMRRDTADGEIVTMQNVVLPPAVRAGDVVQAHASIGPVQVIGELTVLDSGAEGAIVRGVNRDSKREVRVRVLRAGVVEVLHE